MDKVFYQNNRKALLDSILENNGFIVLFSGYPVLKSADEDYDFQVNTNFYYFTGVKQKETILVLTKNGKEYNEFLYIDDYDEHYEKWIGHRITNNEASLITGIKEENILPKSSFDNDLKKYFKAFKNLYLDLFKCNNVSYYSFALDFAKKYKKAKDINTNITLLRMAKKDCEIEEIKKAISTTNHGILNIMKNAKANMYEYQLESFFDQTIKFEGNGKYAFKTIAAGGVNATTLHYSVNNQIVKDNDLVLFDLGCKHEEYSSDITRTFPVNGKFTDLQKKIYNIVLDANVKIASIAKAGMTLKQLQDECKNILAEGCLKAKLIKDKDEINNYYYHNVSHSIGLDTHDPYIREIPLPVGAVISDEPGLYFKQYNIGIRIEDDLLILKDHAEVLSKEIIKTVDDIENYMKG